MTGVPGQRKVQQEVSQARRKHRGSTHDVHVQLGEREWLTEVACPLNVNQSVLKKICYLAQDPHLCQSRLCVVSGPACSKVPGLPCLGTLPILANR